ncbi:MAG: outer membrane protein assembly factor BamA [Deltaproteobacteria bacterium]|nr:outer membrane protein assembly factor BamA [Deltaproteobacteria bacterium]
MLAALLYVAQAVADDKRVFGVVLMPLEMHSTTDISGERRALMEAVANGLYENGAEIKGLDTLRSMYETGQKTFDEESGVTLAKSQGAEFAVVGALALLGNTYTANWRIVDAKSGTLVYFFNITAGSAQELSEKTKEASTLIFDRMKAALYAKPADKEVNIALITVSGNERVDQTAVLKKIKSKTGAPYMEDDVNDDIRSIYSMGYFDDIAVELRPSQGGLELAFLLKEKPTIIGISVSGNSEIKDEKMQELLTVKPSSILNKTEVKETAERIKYAYEQKGFYLTEVTPTITIEDNGAQITFKVNEGPQVKVRSITFIGNEKFSARKLKKKMKTKRKGFFSFITDSGNFDHFTFDEDIYSLQSFYLDNGHINNAVLGQTVLLSEDKRWFDITIVVSEGERYSIGDISFAGDVITTFEELFDKLKIEKGDVYNRSKLTQSIDGLEDLYGDKGYAYVDIFPKTKISEENKNVDITFDITKNELVYIERVDIRGNTKTKDKVIRREVELAEGDLYSYTAFKSSKNNLRRLGYFEDVKLAKSEGSGPNKMKLDVEVKEQPTGQVTFGLGYSSSDKLTATGSISQDNFYGTGLKLGLSATLSATSSNYVFSVTEPWLFDKPLSAGFDVYNSSREYGDFSEHKKGFDVRLGFPLYKRVLRGYVTYRLEDVWINDVSPTASQSLLGILDDSRLSSMNFTVAYDTRDDFYFPREGANAWASVEVAGGPLGGTTYFTKYETSGIKYFPLPLETAVSIRSTFGYVDDFGGKEIPINERYFLGGMNSVRGFESSSLGPKDPVTGYEYGGITKAVLNIEFLFPLITEQRVKGVLFFDAGNAFDGPIDLGNLRKGAGIGLRWFSPMGPLRLEWGQNLFNKTGERKSMLEFTIGGMF